MGQDVPNQQQVGTQQASPWTGTPPMMSAVRVPLPGLHPQEGGHRWVTGLRLCIQQPSRLAPPERPFFRAKAKQMSHLLGSVLSSRGNCSLVPHFCCNSLHHTVLVSVNTGPSPAQALVNSCCNVPTTIPPLGDDHSHDCQPLLAPGPLYTPPHLIPMTASETEMAIPHTTDMKTAP